MFISSRLERGKEKVLTVSAGLDRGLYIANALDGHTVLVVTVDELVLKLAYFVDQDTKLVRNIRNIVVTTFAPDRELLLRNSISNLPPQGFVMQVLQPLPSSHVRRAPCCA